MWSCWKMAKGRRANKQVKAFLAKGGVEASDSLCRLSPSHFPAVFSSALHVSPAATSQCLAEMEGSEQFSVVFSKLRC